MPLILGLDLEGLFADRYSLRRGVISLTLFLELRHMFPRFRRGLGRKGEIERRSCDHNHLITLLILVIFQGSKQFGSRRVLALRLFLQEVGLGRSK